MATSTKIVKDNNKIDIIKTTYSNDFINNINRDGRKKRDYELISDEQFKKCLNQKIATLKAYNKTIDYIKNNNKFNVFLTVRSINKLGLKRLLDRIRKQDGDLKYLTLACWSSELDLHYHILLNTSLNKEQLQSKLKNIDENIQYIYSKKLYRYIKKNLNYDTIHILRQVDNKELRDKQIEILSYAKILSYSKNVKYKPKEIKNPSQEQLLEIYNTEKYEYDETIEYDKLDSSITIDKFTEKS